VLVRSSPYGKYEKLSPLEFARTVPCRSVATHVPFDCSSFPPGPKYTLMPSSVRSFLTAQDRLVKHLRLAKIATLADANQFLETEYWPEWNEHFARPVTEFPNHHRALTEQLDLAAILCHVEERVIGNDYTLSFAGRRYQVLRSEVQAGMRRKRVRMELGLDGELKARYQGRYLEIQECGVRPIPTETKQTKPPVRKDHNAGGRSNWMQGFFDPP
jgi:hypothetical protein